MALHQISKVGLRVSPRPDEVGQLRFASFKIRLWQSPAKPFIAQPHTIGVDDIAFADGRHGKISPRRRGVHTALAAAIVFINSIPRLQAKYLSLPLDMLSAALMDLDSGQVVPLLQAASVEHRPPEAIFRRIIKAFVISAIDELILAGMSMEAACKLTGEKSRNLNRWSQKYARLANNQKLAL
jgi:hypothetical protein